MNSIGIIIDFVVQKKSTPFKKPKNRGGSPNGVSDPPIFATKKIKNTIICVLFFLSALATLKASLFFSISGNIDKVKNSGKAQKVMPRKIIINPLIANTNLELPIKEDRKSTRLNSSH